MPLGTAADHLRRNAYGDLLRRLGANGQSDGCVKPRKLLLGIPRRKQSFACQRYFVVASDTADVRRARFQRLLDDLIIRAS